MLWRWRSNGAMNPSRTAAVGSGVERRSVKRSRAHCRGPVWSASEAIVCWANAEYVQRGVTSRKGARCCASCTLVMPCVAGAAEQRCCGHPPPRPESGAGWEENPQTQRGAGAWRWDRTGGIRRVVHWREGVERQGETRGVQLSGGGPSERCRRMKMRCRNSPKCPNAGPKGVSKGVQAVRGAAAQRRGRQLGWDARVASGGEPYIQCSDA